MLLRNHHTIHLIDQEEKLSPSAFIPFCEFGGNLTAMGRNIDQFNISVQFGIPVCNSFKEKILNNQLCYEVDLNKFSNKENIRNELESGFFFIMDYNEDRQILPPQNLIDGLKSDSFVTKIIESDANQHAFIYLNSIGIILELITIKKI